MVILIIKMSNQLGSVGSKQLFSHVRDSQSTHVPTRPIKQARKPRSYASPKLRPSDWLTGVRCRATSVAKKYIHGNKIVRSFGARTWSGIDFINKDKGVVCTSGTSTMRKGGGEGRWENCENFWVELWRLGEEMVARLLCFIFCKAAIIGSGRIRCSENHLIWQQLWFDNKITGKSPPTPTPPQTHTHKVSFGTYS